MLLAASHTLTLTIAILHNQSLFEHVIGPILLGAPGLSSKQDVGTAYNNTIILHYLSPWEEPARHHWLSRPSTTPRLGV